MPLDGKVSVRHEGQSASRTHTYKLGIDAVEQALHTGVGITEQEIQIEDEFR